MKNYQLLQNNISFVLMVGAFAGGNFIPKLPNNIIDLSFNLIGHYAVGVCSLQMDYGETMAEAYDFEEVTANCMWKTGCDIFPTCKATRDYNSDLNDPVDGICSEEECAIWQMLCNMNLEMKP